MDPSSNPIQVMPSNNALPNKSQSIFSTLSRKYPFRMALTSGEWRMTYVKCTTNNWNMPSRPLHSDTHGYSTIQPPCMNSVISVFWCLHNNIREVWTCTPVVWHNTFISLQQHVQLMSKKFLENSYKAANQICQMKVCNKPITSIHIQGNTYKVAPYMQEVNCVVHIGVNLAPYV
jgi:hypothetical protein